MKRITLQIDESMFYKLKAKVPHGYRTHLIGALLKLVLDAMEDEAISKVVMGAIIAGRFKLVEMGSENER